MRLIIAGTRFFGNYNLLKETVNQFRLTNEITEIVSGAARGADMLGEKYAKEHKIPLKLFPAWWHEIEGKPASELRTNQQGKVYWTKAGIERNGQMAEYADALIAFWDGKSTGTRNMILQAKEHGLLVREVRY